MVRERMYFGCRGIFSIGVGFTKNIQRVFAFKYSIVLTLIHSLAIGSCFAEDTLDMPSNQENVKMDHDSCMELSKHLMGVKNLPGECLQYADVKASLVRHETDHAPADSLLS